MVFYNPTKVFFEKNCFKKNAESLQAIGHCAGIITGKQSSQKNGSLDDVIESLKNNGQDYYVFDGVSANPTIDSVVEIAKEAFLCHVDFVIGVGGGSAMDAAKAIAVLLANYDHINDVETLFYVERYVSRYPIVAVPTTAGTGSEVTGYAVLTDNKKKTKRTIFSALFPNLAFIDSTYFMYASYDSIISPYVDTLSHLIEGFLTTRANDFNRCYSTYGLHMVSRFKDYLRTDEGFNMMPKHQADAMMAASMYGGFAISQNGTSIPHGLSNSVTHIAGIPHGKATASFLPGYLREFENQELVFRLLDILGFSDIETFEEYLYEVMGSVCLEKNLWNDIVMQMMDNTHKLSSYPFVLTRECILRYPGKVLKIVG